MDLPPLPRFSTAEWIAISSAAIAAAAAGTAIWSACTSRQALKIARRQEQRHQSPLELYLADAYIRRVRPERRRVYVFHIVIMNSSDLPNSLRSVDLVVRYVRDGTPGPLIAVPHNAETSYRVMDSVPTLNVPSSIPARGVVAGTVTFSVPDEVLTGADVESYHLSVSDALGRITALEAILLREHDDAEQVALDRDSSTEQR
ncbi:MAG TPA: hypothetical protein VGT40_08065 [Methylomirabilota bacterium]|jgi:hypothetical protein|nr:hypothetical protein [Methylomirabilota bacterium]